MLYGGGGYVRYLFFGLMLGGVVSTVEPLHLRRFYSYDVGCILSRARKEDKPRLRLQQMLNQLFLFLS